MMSRCMLVFVGASLLGACSPTVDLDLRAAFMCRNRDFHASLQSVKLQITDPTGRNVALADGLGTTSGPFSALGLSVPALPAHFDSNDEIDSAFQIRWYGSRSSSADFAPEDLLGYGSTSHIWFTPDNQPEGPVYLPLLEAGRFSPTTDLAMSYNGGSALDICSQMNVGRFGHTATYIPSIGKVLIVGGRTNCDSGDRCVIPEGENRGIRDASSAELFDPSTGTYIPLPSAPGGGRAFHSATLIGNDTVLLAGGRAFVDSRGNEDVLGSAFLFTTKGFLSWLTDVNEQPWSNILTMGTGAEYRRADHAAISVDDSRVVLVGGISDIDTAVSGYPDLTVDIVALTNTLPGVLTFDLNGSRDGGSFSRVGVPLSKPRAGAKLVLRNSQQGPEILVVGGYDAGNAVGAIELLRNLGGSNDQIEIASFGNLQPAVFGHSATVVADKLVVYGGLSRFPDFSSEQRIACSQRGTNAFCYLEHLRLRIPNESSGPQAAAFDSLDLAFAEEVQVIALTLEQANVVNGQRGDEQTEYYDKNLVRGRLWHEAVAIRGNALVVVGGLTKVVFEDRPSKITLSNGVDVELCLVGQNTVCNLPSRLVGGNERKRFRLHGGDSGRADFQLTSLPGDVLLVTGGRIGNDGIDPGRSTQAATSVGQLGVAPFIR
jgi:hypothetical protein